jgi:hypothetical protein
MTLYFFIVLYKFKYRQNVIMLETLLQRIKMINVEQVLNFIVRFFYGFVNNLQGIVIFSIAGYYELKYWTFLNTHVWRIAACVLSFLIFSLCKGLWFPYYLTNEDVTEIFENWIEKPSDMTVKFGSPNSWNILTKQTKEYDRKLTEEPDRKLTEESNRKVNLIKDSRYLYYLTKEEKKDIFEFQKFCVDCWTKYPCNNPLNNKGVYLYDNTNFKCNCNIEIKRYMENKLAEEKKARDKKGYLPSNCY